MSRKRVEQRNISVSISLPPYQLNYITTHPTFNLSKFVQLHFDEYIQLSKEVEKIEKEENINVNQKIE